VADLVSTLVAIDEKQRKKIAARLRSLLSDRDNEVVMAARALNSELKHIGADIHELAEFIERPESKLNEADMKAILNRGIALGVEQERARAASNGHGTPHSSPHGTPGNSAMPSLFHMVHFCFDRVDQLSRDKDREFIRDIHARRIWKYGASPKQQPWIEDLYFKLGGTI
jgi:hypothetical protein